MSHLPGTGSQSFPGEDSRQKAISVLIINHVRYSQVSLMSTDGTTAAFKHSGGVMGIPISSLTDAQITLLNSTSSTVRLVRPAPERSTAPVFAVGGSLATPAATNPLITAPPTTRVTFGNLDSPSVEYADKTPESSLRIVVASGAGTTEDAALKDALTHAVEQAVGVLVDSEILVKNEDVIHDKVLTYSNGFVSKYEVVSQSKTDGLFKVTAKATVEMRALQEKLQSSAVTTHAVDGQSLFATAVTEEKRKEDAKTMLLDALKDFPVNVLAADVVGTPRVVDTKGDDADIEFTLRVTVDRQKYQAFAARLRSVLVATGHVPTGATLTAEDYPGNFRTLPPEEQSSQPRKPTTFSREPSSAGGEHFLYLFLRSDTANRLTQWEYYPLEASIAQPLALMAMNSLRVTTEFVDQGKECVFFDQVGTYSIPRDQSYANRIPLSFHFAPTSQGRFNFLTMDREQNEKVGIIDELKGAFRKAHEQYLFISPYFTWNTYNDGMEATYTASYLLNRRLKVSTADLKKVQTVRAKVASDIPLPPVITDYPASLWEYSAFQQK